MVLRPNPNTPKIAIIGAGMAGLSAARALGPQCNVSLFDKSRGVGGRMSTRYVRSDKCKYEFDHGAQYFTARNPDFQSLILTAVEAGAAAPWQAKGMYAKNGVMSADTGSDRFVGTPRMNSLPKFLAQDLGISLDRKVSECTKAANGWTLRFETGADAGGFDAVISTIPPEQAQRILPEDFAHMDKIKSAKMQACFALMIGLGKDTGFDAQWDSLRLGQPALDWAALNSSKPERSDDGPSLVLHASGDWSEIHQDADRDWVQDQMLAAAKAGLGMDLSAAAHISLHRWLYAAPEGNVNFPQESLFDARLNLAICGDWCAGGRVEGAWLSGRNAAKQVLEAHNLS